MQIARGQRLKLADLGLDGQPFSIALTLADGGLVVDSACFGLDAARKLSDERYMTFFNQPASPCGAVKLASGGRFDFDLARLPATIESLTVTLAIDGAGTMSKLGNCVATLSRGGTSAATYAFDGGQFSAERAIMLLELYRKDGQWRLNAVSQGFNGGLDALVTHFGGSVADKPSAPPPAPQAAPPSAPPPSPPPVPPSRVSLSKITLDKRGDQISLEKRGSGKGHGRIECNLNWTSGGAPAKKGLLGGLFGGGRSSGIDLDLGCLFELSDGRKSVVQALGNCFGDFNRAPFINLAGDDRTGASTSGEFLYINGDHLAEIKRICVFAFIYEGVANWAQADGVVTVTVPGHPVIEVRLDGHQPSKNMCAIAMLENHNGELRVTKLAEYFAGHPDLDRHYGWGMRWTEGSK